MAASGIREGRARFGDDVRERARKYFEAQKKGKAPEDKPATKKPAPKATKPAVKKPAPPKATKPAPKAEVKPTPKPEAKPTPVVQKPKTSTQAGPKMSFPRDVGTPKAAKAREEMFAAKSPIEDIAQAAKDKFRPKPASEAPKLPATATPYSDSGSSPMLMNAKRRREMEARAMGMEEAGMKKGGKVKKMAKGGSVSKRADGIAQRGKTKGRML